MLFYMKNDENSTVSEFADHYWTESKLTKAPLTYVYKHLFIICNSADVCISLQLQHLTPETFPMDKTFFGFFLLFNYSIHHVYD